MPDWPTANIPANTRVSAVYGSPLLHCVAEGEAYRVSKRLARDDGQEFTVHIDPVSAGGTVHIAAPAIEAEEAADVDVWENADPGADTVDDLFVHNMRYDSGQGSEQPEATIVRVTDSGLDTTGADKTEETLIQGGGVMASTGDEDLRGIWRTIPVGETISIVVTDRSGGNDNRFSFDTVVYEGEILPD